MTARSRARRDRAASAPAALAPLSAGPAKNGTDSAIPPARRLALPRLPMLAALFGLILLALAWTTRQPPGPPRASAATARFTLDIPADRARVINSWERFFVCYDLTDPAIVDLTLRANQRANGNLDFPGEKVIVELPGATRDDDAPASAAEDQLIAARNAVMGAAVPERLASIRAQCAG